MKNIKFKTIVPALLCMLMLGLTAGPAHAYTSGLHRIGMHHARAIALKVHSGRVEREVLVHRSDGQERYVVVIRNRSGRYAVGVDAKSGAVLANVKEGQAGHQRVRRGNFWNRLFAPTRFGT